MHHKISLGSRLVTNPNLVLRVEDDDCGLLFDPDLGRTLCSVMHEAGLEGLSVDVRPYWLNALGVIDSDVLDMITELLQVMRPTIARVLGSQGKAERYVERVLENFKRPDTVYFPLSFTVSGRKPA